MTESRPWAIEGRAMGTLISPTAAPSSNPSSDFPGFFHSSSSLFFVLDGRAKDPAHVCFVHRPTNVWLPPSCFVDKTDEDLVIPTFCMAEFLRINKLVELTLTDVLRLRNLNFPLLLTKNDAHYSMENWVLPTAKSPKDNVISCLRVHSEWLQADKFVAVFATSERLPFLAKMRYYVRASDFAILGTFL